MGRRSLEAVRSQEIIDATRECIVTYGLADTTLQKIADQAGMKRSAIAHFLGNREQVIAAAIEHSCGYYIRLLEDIVADGPPDRAVDRLIDRLVGGGDVDTRAMVLFDEILTLAHHDDGARTEIARAYGMLEQALVDGLAARYPAADPSKQAGVAHALMLLIDNEERFRVLGLSRGNPQGQAARDAARALVASLDHRTP